MTISHPRRKGLGGLAGLSGLAGLAALGAPARAATAGSDASGSGPAAPSRHQAQSHPPSLQHNVSPDPDIPAPGRALRFPRDFGAHLGTRIEWWYVTGALRTPANGDIRYGFQITFFRSRTALAEPAQAAASQPPSSRLRARHLLFAHAALTDLQTGKLVHAERIARWNGEDAAGASTAAAGASTTDTAVHIGRWHLRRQGTPEASIYEGAWQDDDAGFGLQMQLRTTQTLLLQGDQGYSRKSPRPGHASAYYSQPQLRAEGTLRLQGRPLRVEGTAWLDHEWSSALLDPEAVGWDWMGLNLDDGSALTVFRLRRADGSVLWAGGSWRARDHAVKAFASNEVQMLPGRTWRSPATDAVYPVEWTIQTPAGRFTLRALADAQELDNRQRTGTVYWEGLSALQDTNGRRVGMGYLEMTGYAGRLLL